MMLMDRSSLWHFLAQRDLHLDKGQRPNPKDQMLMAEVKSLGMASRVRKPSKPFILAAGSKKCRELPTMPSPFITINNEEVIFYISPHADADTVELIIKGKKVHRVTPNNFGFGGGENEKKGKQEGRGKDWKGGLSTQGMKEKSL